VIDNKRINLIADAIMLAQPQTGMGQLTLNVAMELKKPEQAGKFLGLNVLSKHLMPIFLR
jgi:hypothetical protein